MVLKKMGMATLSAMMIGGVFTTPIQAAEATTQKTSLTKTQKKQIVESLNAQYKDTLGQMKYKSYANGVYTFESDAYQIEVEGLDLSTTSEQDVQVTITKKDTDEIATITMQNEQALKMALDYGVTVQIQHHCLWR